MAIQTKIDIGADVSGFKKGMKEAKVSVDNLAKSEEDLRKQLTPVKTAFNIQRRSALELANAYRQMTDAERKSDWGKTVSRNMEQAIQKAAEMKDVMEDVNQQIRNLASDTSFSDGMNMMAQSLGSVSTAVLALTGNSENMKSVLMDVAKIQATINAVKQLTTAFQSQNLVLLKNPLVLGATAVGGLIYGITKYIQGLTDAKKATDDFNVATSTLAQNLAEISKSMSNTFYLNASPEDIDKLVIAKGKLSKAESDLSRTRALLYSAEQRKKDGPIDQKTMQDIEKLKQQYQQALQNYKNANIEINNLKEKYKDTTDSVVKNNEKIKKSLDDVDKSWQKLGLNHQSHIDPKNVPAPNPIGLIMKTEKGKGNGIDWDELLDAGATITPLLQGYNRLDTLAQQYFMNQVSNNKKLAKMNFDSMTNAQKQLDILKKSLSDLQPFLNDPKFAANKESMEKSAFYLKEQIKYWENILEVKGNISFNLIQTPERILSNAAGLERSISQLSTKARKVMWEEMMKGNSEPDAAMAAIATHTQEIEEMARKMGEAFNKEFTQQLMEFTNDAAFGYTMMDAFNEVLARRNQKFNEMRENIGAVVVATNSLGSAFSSLGAAMDAPVFNIMGTIAQAVANIALAYSDAFVKDQVTKTNIFAFIGSVISGVASMGAAIAQVKKATAYADGGIIEGATTIGDYNIARVNDGEMILNKRQQRHLFNALDNGFTPNSTTTGGEVKFKIQGTELVGVLRNQNKKMSHVL